MESKVIRVQVEGMGPVKKYVVSREILIPQGARAASLASLYSIPDKMNPVYLIGGTRRPPSTPLNEGDCVTIVSMLSGG